MTIKVEIIADTVHPQVPTARITTFQIYAPRFLLAEINTHRVLSRSAQSSRAIPVKKRIAGVRTDPYIPEFTKNQKGMQASGPVDGAVAEEARLAWIEGMSQAIESADELAEYEVHKQQANRILEPYAHFYGVITGTEWDNFWELRCSPMAQPEFQALASDMLALYWRSTPRIGTTHCPYIDDEVTYSSQFANISAARCARVSYKTFDTNKLDPEADLRLADDLIKDKHMSPFDHPAMADILSRRNTWVNPEDHRQYWGWIPYRVSLEVSLGMLCRRSSWVPVEGVK